MRGARRSISVLLAVPLCAGLLALTGCSGPGGERVTVGRTAQTVTIGVGDTLVVDFGRINTSVGDAWELTQPPDEAVLTVGDVEYELVNPDADGTPGDLAYTFVGKGPGTTTIGFTYSYRGVVGSEEGRVEEPTPTIEVTVVADRVVEG